MVAISGAYPAPSFSHQTDAMGIDVASVAGTASAEGISIGSEPPPQQGWPMAPKLPVVDVVLGVLKEVLDVHLEDSREVHFGELGVDSVSSLELRRGLEGGKPLNKQATRRLMTFYDGRCVRNKSLLAHCLIGCDW